MANRKYTLNAHEYLARAKKLIKSDDYENYFYAALELRFAIEARLSHCVEANQRFLKKKKLSWGISKLRKDLEKAFEQRDRVVQIIFTDSAGRRVMNEFFTPISSKLENLGERLGNYLHVQKHKDDSHKKWWREFRKHLKDTVILLDRALYGDLLGPPMWNKVTGDVKMSLARSKIPKFPSSGIADLEVKYHDLEKFKRPK